jgi:hypothetical protein
MLRRQQNRPKKILQGHCLARLSYFNLSNLPFQRYTISVAKKKIAKEKKNITNLRNELLCTQKNHLYFTLNYQIKS